MTLTITEIETFNTDDDDYGDDHTDISKLTLPIDPPARGDGIVERDHYGSGHGHGGVRRMNSLRRITSLRTNTPSAADTAVSLAVGFDDIESDIDDSHYHRHQNKSRPNDKHGSSSSNNNKNMTKDHRHDHGGGEEEEGKCATTVATSGTGQTVTSGQGTRPKWASWVEAFDYEEFPWWAAVLVIMFVIILIYVLFFTG